MKPAKLAELTVDELRREESTLQEQIFRLRFQIRTGNAENPSKLGETRRDLARVKTILRARELGARGAGERAAAAADTSEAK